MQGKKVAVIGTGSSGLQCIQTIGPKVGHLTVFQRTPNLATPMHNPKLTASEPFVHKDEVLDSVGE
jgi:cation diffusion facilitator CzcD-associated flavoprotein CzcO